jgi:putative glutamine amidotransferase
MEQKPIILVTSLREPSSKGGDLSVFAVCAPYLNALCAHGAIPLGVPLCLQKNEFEQLSDMAQGLFIPGGDDLHPKHYGATEIHEKTGECSEERDELELSLIRVFIEKKKPIFGVCRGAQVINVAMGGTLYQDIESEVETDISHKRDENISMSEYFLKEVHDVIFVKNTSLSSFFPIKKIMVNSLHHQAIKDVAPGLRVNAYAADQVIEAVESEDMSAQWILGVQWHPEMLIEKHPENKILFEKFIEAARKKIAN